MKPLRIAINALYLLPGGVGGTEIYLRQLLTALERVDQENEYLIFTNRETGRDLAPVSPRFRHLPQPVQAEIRPLRILYEQSSLPSIIDHEGVDLVFNPGFTSPKSLHVPAVTVFHDLQHVHHPEYFRKRELPFWNLLLSQAARASARIIAASEATRRDVIEHYHLPDAKVVTIPHGVEEAFFRLERNPDTENPFLLCVSTLDPNKNIEKLIQVFGGLRGEFPKLKLVLAGLRGMQTARVEALVDELGLRSAVRITGWIPRQDIYGLYERATAFVYPSTFEGFGLPVLEAMAAGVPLACSRIDPLVEVAGDAASFFDPKSEQEMAQAIWNLLTEPEATARQVERGKKRASGFTWEESARRTLGVFEDVARAGDSLEVSRA
jgi:glycosyltransferase involved in cell wall biosynthesis